jgi:Tsi6
MNTITFSDIHQAVDTAIAMTDSRIAKLPNYGVYLHAKEQLGLIHAVLMTRVAPTEKEKSIVDIGLMAVRELEVEEPDYAEVLIYVAARFNEL